MSDNIVYFSINLKLLTKATDSAFVFDGTALISKLTVQRQKL